VIYPKRRFFIAAALVTTLVAAYFAPARTDDAVQPTAHARATSPTDWNRDGEAAPTEVQRGDTAAALRPRTDDDNQGLLAAFASPAAPSAPAPAPTPPPVAPVAAQPMVVSPPVPPPLPFEVVGRMVDGGDQRLFLVFNGKNIVVHTGDTIGTDYTVSEIKADQLVVHYAPLDVSQTVTLPASH